MKFGNEGDSSGGKEHDYSVQLKQVNNVQNERIRALKECYWQVCYTDQLNSIFSVKMDQLLFELNLISYLIRNRKKN